jgi:hypothetical protein
MSSFITALSLSIFSLLQILSKIILPNVVHFDVNLLNLQIEYGDLKSSDSSLSQQVCQIIDRFYPRKYREPATSDGIR